MNKWELLCKVKGANVSLSLFGLQTVDDDAMEAWMRFGVAVAERCPRVGVLKPPSWRTSHSTPTWWRNRVGRRWENDSFIFIYTHNPAVIIHPNHNIVVYSPSYFSKLVWCSLEREKGRSFFVQRLIYRHNIHLAQILSWKYFLKYLEHENQTKQNS